MGGPLGLGEGSDRSFRISEKPLSEDRASCVVNNIAIFSLLPLAQKFVSLINYVWATHNLTSSHLPFILDPRQLPKKVVLKIRKVEKQTLLRMESDSWEVGEKMELDLTLQIILWIGFWLAVIFIAIRRMNSRQPDLPDILPDEIEYRPRSESFKDDTAKIIRRQQPDHSEANEEQG